ncbi:MAG TPA: cytochrome c [Opitutaceae bacterium]
MSHRLLYAALLLAVAKSVYAATPAMLTYDTRPHGTVEVPLILRTYLPDPGLDDTVMVHHGRGEKTSEYSPEKGEDIPGEVVPLKGVPAAIAVNHGPELSYVFDTTEGRLLYAWQGGFLDMFPYWGEKDMGTRLYDYVPRLVGILFYQAAGRHPLEIDGRSVSEAGAPRFLGYDLVGNQPTFIVRYGRHTVRTRVRPLPGQQRALRIEFSVEPAARLSFRTENTSFALKKEDGVMGTLALTLAGPSLGSYEGYSRKVTITEASVAAGEQFARNYACAVCHSTDGSMGHGPTWAGLFGRERVLADGTKTIADDAYILEAIKNPDARIVQGFAPSFMPPYSQLGELEYESLLLYIKSLRAGQ